MKNENQKLKALYLLKVLSEKTDEDHALSMAELIDELNEYGITAERKSLYTDMQALSDMGYDIIKTGSAKTAGYKLVSRDFELAELKLLVDAVQSSKFITKAKSNGLIKKLETLCSENEAKQLHRQVYVEDRVKSMNEAILYNVDAIHNAINENKKISFKYWNWSVDKKMELRKDGAEYIVSPWGLSWDDQNYYLIAFDDTDKKIKHYRVDKMLNIEVLDEKREGKNSYRDLNMAEYSRKQFGMFGGEELTVTIECENRFAGVMIDRFGKDVTLIKRDKEHFAVCPKVAVSEQFIGWIISLGTGVKLTGPNEVVEMMKQEIKRLKKTYC